MQPSLFAELSEIYLTRRQAADYLLEKFGKPGSVTPSTLAKLAVIGGGPLMRRFGRKVGYLSRDLDAWGLSRLTGPCKNTSDAGVGKTENAAAC